ncbi:MAG: hypothetical protein NUV52_02030 [Candidatus Roizmanbacteria bacterium]|nr:hypothetical protein [Candidatus Roizmanbacteria bacterium]
MKGFFIGFLCALLVVSPVIAQEEAAPSVTVKPQRPNVFRESLLKKSVTTGPISLDEAKVRLTNLLDTALEFITSIEMNITGEGTVDELNGFVLERITAQKQWVSEAQNEVQSATTIEELRTTRDELSLQWRTRKQVARLYGELKRIRHFAQLYSRVFEFSVEVESKVEADNESLIDMKANLDEANRLLEEAKTNFVNLSEETLEREATPPGRLNIKDGIGLLRKAVENGKQALRSLSITPSL